MTEYTTYQGNKYRIDYSEEKTSEGGQWVISFGFFEIKLKRLLILCAVILVIFLLWKVYESQQTLPIAEDNSLASPVDSSSRTLTVSSQSLKRFAETGIVFPDSNERLLTIRDVDELSLISGYSEKELLRFAVNELYARHGYLFQTEKYAEHYNSYGFEGYTDAETAVSNFNEYELANLSFLCSIENARGYR